MVTSCATPENTLPVVRRRLPPAGLMIGLVALAAALAPTPAAIVERWYARRLYLLWQPFITAASNHLPFALSDVLLIAAASAWLGALVLDAARHGRAGWPGILGRGVMRTLAIAGPLYLAFLAAWGLNYRRVPLADKLQFDRSGVSSAGASRLAEVAVDRLNALYDRSRGVAPAPGDLLDGPLAAAFARVQRELGAARLAVPGRPKHTLLDFYFRRAAVDGLTDPFFLETLVAGDLLSVERPFVIAHEWSHLAGYADEGEASFVGWLSCLRGSDADQYSGWLFLYGDLLRALGPEDRSRVAARLGAGPAADRRAIAERVRRDVDPRVARAGWRVYDRYLRANRVEAGAASYEQVVRLVLGTRFGSDWTPISR